MSFRQKESLYNDRIFGGDSDDDETPPKPKSTRFAAPKPTQNGTSNQSNGNGNGVYPFRYDIMGSARLNLQHFLWTSSLGYHLHPSIPLKKNALVADIGCGTGIWSITLADKLPAGSKIEAYDLSLAQSPPKEWWPQNVTFHELDALAPIPQRLVGRYDVVNLRCFICVIQAGDPMPLLTSLLKMLKPGGILQWQEYDVTSPKIITADPTASAPKMQLLSERMRSATAVTKPNRAKHWIEDFHTRFEEASGELIAHERKPTPRELMILKQEAVLLSVREWFPSLRAKDHPELEELEKTLEEAEDECWKMHRGSAVEMGMVTWVVKKRG